jgi:salicylate hydroxylase
MTQQLLIAGGGIGGLSAAIAARRAGWEARLFEQAHTLSEAGAGIQLGPNATRILREWGLLESDLRDLAAAPRSLRVRDAVSGRELASLRLGDPFEQRYGAPYLTLHRADLQSALLRAAEREGARLHTDRRLEQVSALEQGVRVTLTNAPEPVEGEALVAADGLWSVVRPELPGTDAPRATGHLAFRGLARQSGLPAAQRSQEVTAWLGPRMHGVTYPVRGGEWLNVVCVVQGKRAGDARSWDHEAAAPELEAALGPACAALRDLLHAVPGWRLWMLHDRAPLRAAGQMAAGRIALLGDAAHPMLPYLAQGAGMALEDARELQRVLAVADGRTLDVPTALQRYALNRWERCARVQRRSRRNGVIFHASGPLRWGRNAALGLLGERLLDLPWLYRGAAG